MSKMFQNAQNAPYSMSNYVFGKLTTLMHRWPVREHNVASALIYAALLAMTANVETVDWAFVAGRRSRAAMNHVRVEQPALLIGFGIEGWY